MTTTIQTGLLFHALVAVLIAMVAAVFVVFLSRRWKSLDRARHAYTGFWVVTALVWSAIAARYFMIGMGYWGGEISFLDIFIQSAVFVTGPPLFYYAGLRVLQHRWAAVALALVSCVFTAMGIYFILQPEGIVRVAVTGFSAETNLNPVSYSIFISNIAILVILMVYDLLSRLRQWFAQRNDALFYDALYSAALLVYVGLGGIDNSKIFLEWELVILRICYIAAFLFAYRVIVEHELAQEHFLIEDVPRNVL